MVGWYSVVCFTQECDESSVASLALCSSLSDSVHLAGSPSDSESSGGMSVSESVELKSDISDEDGADTADTASARRVAPHMGRQISQGGVAQALSHMTRFRWVQPLLMHGKEIKVGVPCFEGDSKQFVAQLNKENSSGEWGFWIRHLNKQRPK